MGGGGGLGGICDGHMNSEPKLHHASTCHSFKTFASFFASKKHIVFYRCFCG